MLGVMSNAAAYLSQVGVLLSQLSSQPDKQDCSSRALDHASCRVLLHHLDQAHPVSRAHLVQQANGVVLCHVVCAGLQAGLGAAAESTKESTRLGPRGGFSSFRLPPADNILGDWEEVVGRDEGGRGYRGVLVDNARLDETLDGLYGGGIDNAAQGTDGVGAVDDIAGDGGVLHDGRGDHDHVVGGASELLDDQVDHLAQRCILVLEQLGDAEEEGGGFLTSPALAGEEQQGELGEDHPALPRRDGALVEDAGILKDGCLVDLGDAADILLLLVHVGVVGVVVAARDAALISLRARPGLGSNKASRSCSAKRGLCRGERSWGVSKPGAAIGGVSDWGVEDECAGEDSGLRGVVNWCTLKLHPGLALPQVHRAGVTVGCCCCCCVFGLFARP